MAESNPIFAGGNKPRSFTAGGTIAGGQVVVLSAADTVVASSAASAAVVGVAGDDAVNGEQVTVWPLAGCTHEVTASAAVVVGDNLQSSTAGKVAPIVLTPGTADFARVIGVATTAAAGDGIKCQMVGR
jgi:hypothetical protein